MSKTLFVFLVLGLVPTAMLAASFSVQETYNLQKGEVASGDTYTVSGDTVIAGDVTGDLAAVGGNVLVSGSVGQDLSVVGGSFNLPGSIKDDLRAIGGNISLSGSVGGDFIAAGGQVHILQSAVVGGDIAVASGELVIEGKVGGSVRSAGNRLYINNEVAGSVYAYGGKIVLGPKAIVRGDLTYKSERPANIDPAAKVEGKIDFQETGETSKHAGNLAKGLFKAVHVFKFFAYLACALIFSLLLKRLSNTLVHQSLDRFGHNLLVGFLVAVAVPVVAILLLVSLLASPLGVLMLFGYTAWMLLAWIVGALVAGAWLYNLYAKKQIAESNWKTAVIGVMALSILGAIPLIGWAMKCVFMLVALGVLARTWYHHIWLNR